MHVTPFAARVAFICSLLVGLIPINAAAKQKWIKASTDEVYIISDASPKAVTEYAVKYSAFRQAFGKILAPEGRPPPPVVLMLFRNDKELKDHLQKSEKFENTVAVNIEVDNTAVLALSDVGLREDALSLAFEFDTIWSLRRVGYLLPLWITQGTGEVMGAMQIRKNECVIGGDLARVLPSWNRGSKLAWKRFFDVYQGSPEYSGDDATGVYQAQAWALMNLILFQEDKPRERFLALVKKIYERQNEMEAVEALVGVPAEKLERAANRQIGGNHTVKIPFDEKAILARIKIEPADEAEVMIRQSDLLVAYGRVREGEALLDQAAALAPQATYVNEALARRELRRNEQSAAARYYRIATAAGTTNTNAWLISAAERLTQVQSYGNDVAGGGSGSTITALEEVHRALQLDPGDLNAWRLLGRVYFVLEKPDEAGVAELSRAVTESENGLQVRYYRGLLQSRLGQMDGALTDLDYIMQHPRTPTMLRQSATAFKIQLQFGADKKRAEQLVKQKQYDEARTLLVRGNENAAGTAMAKPYRGLLAWVEENARWFQVVELYNQRDWPGALAAVKLFSEEYPRSSLIKDARKLAALAEENNQRATRAKARQE